MEGKKTKAKNRAVALSEKRLTRTKEQKRSMKACRINEFWWGCQRTEKKRWSVQHIIEL